MKTKPYQILAWISTFSILTGAVLASVIPELYWHHPFFIMGNGLLAIVSYLWREFSLVVLNLGLSIIYIIGIIFDYFI